MGAVIRLLLWDCYSTPNKKKYIYDDDDNFDAAADDNDDGDGEGNDNMTMTMMIVYAWTPYKNEGSFSTQIKSNRVFLFNQTMLLRCNII